MPVSAQLTAIAPSDPPVLSTVTLSVLLSLDEYVAEPKTSVDLKNLAESE
jgi:hypothetical protein